MSLKCAKVFYGFVTVYLDYILIYSNNLNKYLIQLKKVFEWTKDSKLYCTLKNCGFRKDSIKLMRNKISNGIAAVDPSKTIVVSTLNRIANTVRVKLYI